MVNSRAGLRHIDATCSASLHPSVRCDFLAEASVTKPDLTVQLPKGKRYKMALNPTMATAVFGLYFAVIIALFGLVITSVLPSSDKTRVFRQKPFLFLRCAAGALLSTWYCEFPAPTYLADEADTML